MIDQLRQLGIFAKTIDHGSFRGAAKELRLSPSVLSHHISQLEDHLGVALIYRSTRKLSLTPDGERLLKATRKMLDAVEGELYDLTARASEPSGELRITAPSVLSQSPFIEAMAGFLARYPRIRLQLDFSDTRQELISGGFDVAIRMSLRAERSPTTRELFRVPRKLLASTVFLAEQHTPRTPDDLAEMDWLELAPLQRVPAVLRKGEVEQHVLNRKPAILSSNDAHALYRLVLAGAGIAVLPEFLAEKDMVEGRIEEILPDWHLEQAVVFAEWPSNAPRNGLIRLLVDELATSRS